MYHFVSGFFYAILFSYFSFYEIWSVIQFSLTLISPYFFDIFSLEIQYYRNHSFWTHVPFTSDLKLRITLNLTTYDPSQNIWLNAIPRRNIIFFKSLAWCQTRTLLLHNNAILWLYSNLSSGNFFHFYYLIWTGLSS